MPDETHPDDATRVESIPLGEDATPASGAGPSGPMKTPYFQAFNAIRYQRQSMIKAIERDYDRQLICYVAGLETSVDRDDPIKIVDLLHNVRRNESLDFLLHTPGGDIDSAEKIMKQIRSCVGTATLRVIVPDFAKSSGTLMALAADVIVMSDMSELGPIDPQVALTDSGVRRWHSIDNYLDAYAELTKAVNSDPENQAARILLSRMNPATVKLFESTRIRAREIAETHLKSGMFNTTGNWSQTASTLIDTNKWPSHGQMISWQDAQAPDLGLVVEYLEPDSDEWQQYWQLFCLQRLAIGDENKLFESNYASLLVPG